MAKDEDDFDALLKTRPDTLIPERMLECLPTYEINPEWEAKRAAGELREGLLGICGMSRSVWPEQRLTENEAKWVLAVREYVSWRSLASIVFGDSNQILGKDLEDAAHRSLGRARE